MSKVYPNKSIMNEYLNKQISEEYRLIILKVIDEKCPSKKKSKYLNAYYLENIIYMLNDVCKWESLSLLHPDKPKYHYKTICDKYLEWVLCGVFEIAHNILLTKSHFIVNLYIDSFEVYNLNGSEYTEYGSNKKKRRQQKCLSLLMKKS